MSEADAASGGRQYVPPEAGDLLPRSWTWLRRNLFSTPLNTVLTLAVAWLAWTIVPPILDWTVVNATISGATKAACGPDGACWTFIRMRLPTFIFGRYPPDEYWRIGLAAGLLALLCWPVMREQTRHRWVFLVLLLVAFPLVAGILLAGGIFGLRPVDTNAWGGLMLDVIVCFVTVSGSLPLGILLALGRRSALPVVRTLSVCFIELWRGVPLLTVLFLSAVIVPLFLPEGVSIDRLIRAMAALILFNAAYMAEVVRGGLQGVHEGQEEAAYSLGLSWWKANLLVVLPQALRMVVPAIINTVVDLFKETTLITIIGLSDLLGAVDQALKDPSWLGLAKEGYLFAALVFFVCCFAMSSYGRGVERRLARVH
jgi:general L-amino acid transport system permease protein